MTVSPTSPLRARVGSPSFVALVLITGITALCTDTYIAALPAVGSDLEVSASTVQLTLTACVVGMAVGQLVLAPISDAQGRRPFLVASTLVFAVASVVCAVAGEAWILISARVVQGVACGLGAAVARAVISDVSAGRGLAAKFGTLSAVALIAPVVGPTIGGFLLAFGDWRTIFWFLSAAGIAVTAAAVVGLPETLTADRRQPGGVRQQVHRTKDLLLDRAVVVPLAVQSIAVGGFFVYIGGSSFVLQQGVGLSPYEYAAVFAVNALTMMLSSVLYRILVVRTGPLALRRVAIIVQTSATAVLFFASLLAHPYPPVTLIVICLALMTAGLGTFLPASASLVQGAGRRFGGTTSALVGGVPLLTGAVFTPLTGFLGAESVRAMASATFTLFAAAAVLAVWQRKAVVDITDDPPASAQFDSPR